MKLAKSKAPPASEAPYALLCIFCCQKMPVRRLKDELEKVFLSKLGQFRFVAQLPENFSKTAPALMRSSAARKA